MYQETQTLQQLRRPSEKPHSSTILTRTQVSRIAFTLVLIDLTIKFVKQATRKLLRCLQRLTVQVRCCKTIRNAKYTISRVKMVSIVLKEVVQISIRGLSLKSTSP